MCSSVPSFLAWYQICRVKDVNIYQWMNYPQFHSVFVILILLNARVLIFIRTKNNVSDNFKLKQERSLAQEQPFGKFRKSYRKVSLRQNIFITKFQVFLLKKLLRRWCFHVLFRNFSKQFLCRTPSSDCFCYYTLSIIFMTCFITFIEHFMWLFYVILNLHQKINGKCPTMRSLYKIYNKIKPITFHTINTPSMSIIMIINVHPIVK